MKFELKTNNFCGKKPKQKKSQKKMIYKLLKDNYKNCGFFIPYNICISDKMCSSVANCVKTFFNPKNLPIFTPAALADGSFYFSFISYIITYNIPLLVCCNQLFFFISAWSIFEPRYIRIEGCNVLGHFSYL